MFLRRRIGLKEHSAVAVDTGITASMTTTVNILGYRSGLSRADATTVNHY